MLTTYEPSWLPVLSAFDKSPEATKLRSFLQSQKSDDVLPARDCWFEALELCPLPAVRVVIVGQDPYPTPGEACGLAFSAGHAQTPPPSLANVYQNLREVAGQTPPPDADLRGWAQQGVLLLNRVLTVAPYSPGSHRNQGWEALTNRILQAVNALPHTVVFLLWGRDAQQAAVEVGLNRARHTVLPTSHPSPKGAKYGFTKSRHFVQVHAVQDALGHHRVDWSRPYDVSMGPALSVSGVSHDLADGAMSEMSEMSETLEVCDNDEIEPVPKRVVKRARMVAPTAALWTTGQPGVEQAAVTWLRNEAPPAVWARWTVRGVVPVRAQCLDGSRWPKAVTTYHMTAVNPLGHVARELAAAWEAVLTQVRGVLVVSGPATKTHMAFRSIIRGATAKLGATQVYEVADVTDVDQCRQAVAWARALPVPQLALTGAFALTNEGQLGLVALLSDLLDP